MNKKNIIFFVIIGILSVLLAGSVFLLLKDAPTQDQPTQVVTDKQLQVVSQVQLKTWTADGAIVVMDDSSTFGQLNVFVPKNMLDNKYVGGDYLSVYHNGVIKDAEIAQFDHIYKIETYHINSDSLYRDWDTAIEVDLSHVLFTDTIWPAIKDNYVGQSDNLTPISVLATSKSYDSIYAVLCSENNGEHGDALMYYVQIQDGAAHILLSESVLARLERLQQD